MKWHGRTIYPGIARGLALTTSMGISFFGGVDPDSGVVVERGHELEGQSIAGKVLIFPSGKGSTVGSYALYRLAFNGKAPAAVVNLECEPITAVGCIIAEIPCIDRVSIREIQTGQYLQVDGQAGILETIPRPESGALSLPDPLNGTDPNSFAHFTISERLPKIVRQVIADSPWTDDIRARLQGLHDDLPAGRLGLLRDEDAPDAQDWDRYLRPYQHQSWLEAPWFLTETAFFRRILSATGYFQSGPGRDIDPYAAQKRQGMSAVLDGMHSFYKLLGENAASRLQLWRFRSTAVS